jgi:hypothetical protein
MHAYQVLLGFKSTEVKSLKTLNLNFLYKSAGAILNRKIFQKIIMKCKTK